MARPRKAIDWDQFEKLCAIQATLEEIAGWFDCSPDTIERACKRQFRASFAEIFGRYSGKGKTSLRRTQWQVALKGNVRMLIHLGNQHLGQAVKVEKRLVDKDGNDVQPNGVQVHFYIPDNGRDGGSGGA